MAFLLMGSLYFTFTLVLTFQNDEWLYTQIFIKKTGTGQGVSSSIPGSVKVLLSFFRHFENFSIVARSLKLLNFIELKTQLVKSGYTLYSGITCRNVHIYLSL
ncbi:hypothetical protein SFRURICE_020017 [Spodoptera frugiperda]|nr:hypothetical protein SFRURICE_020017 [Spodoptera frugiperda]